MNIGKIVNIKEGEIKVYSIILSLINSIFLTLVSVYILNLINIKTFKIFTNAEFFSNFIYYSFIDISYTEWLPPTVLIIINTLYTVKLIDNNLYKYYAINSYGKELKLVLGLLTNAIGLAFKATFWLLLLIPFKFIFNNITIESTTFYVFCWSWLLPILSKSIFKKVFYDTEKRYNPNYDKSIKKRYEKKYNKVNKRTKQEIEKEVYTYTEGYERYNSDDFIDKLNNENKKYPHSYVFQYKNNEYRFTRNKKYIESYTNDKKYFALDKHIKMLKNKYKVNDILEIKDKVLININTLISENNNIPYDFDNLYNKSQKEKKLRIYKDLKDIARDTSYLLNNRLYYLKNEYTSAKLGYEGEVRVNKELSKYADEFINIKNKIFRLGKIKGFNEDYTMECDNIIISRHGVFVIETKNKGEFSVFKDSKNRLQSKYKLLIEEEGRWVNVYPDGSKEVWENDPVYQNRNHVLKVRKIINDKLGLTMDDEDYVDVKSIIVIANENLEIDNRTNHSICRVQAIYSEITEKHDRIFNGEQMNMIKDVLDSFDTKEHPPQKYDSINVYEEITTLEKSLNNYVKKHNIEECFLKLNKVLQKHHDAIKVIDKDRSKQESKKKHSRLFEFNERRIPQFIIFILISALVVGMPLKFLGGKNSLSDNDNRIEIKGDIKGQEFSSPDELSSYVNEKIKWFKYKMDMLGFKYEESNLSHGYIISFKEYYNKYISNSESDKIYYSVKYNNGKIEECLSIQSQIRHAEDYYTENKTKFIKSCAFDPYLKFIYYYIVKFENYRDTYFKFVMDVQQAYNKFVMDLKQGYNNTTSNTSLYCGNVEICLSYRGVKAQMGDLIHTIK